MDFLGLVKVQSVLPGTNQPIRCPVTLELPFAKSSEFYCRCHTALWVVCAPGPAPQCLHYPSLPASSGCSCPQRTRALLETRGGWSPASSTSLQGTCPTVATTLPPQRAKRYLGSPHRLSRAETDHMVDSYTVLSTCRSFFTPCWACSTPGPSSGHASLPRARSPASARAATFILTSSSGEGSGTTQLLSPQLSGCRIPHAACYCWLMWRSGLQF